MSKRSRARRAKTNAKARKAAEAQKHQAQTKTEEDQAKITQYLADKRAAQDTAQATQAAAAQKQAAAAAEAAQTEQWLTTKETLALAQISRTTMHLKTKAGTFPQAIKIGKKCVWIRSEIDQWIKGVSYI